MRAGIEEPQRKSWFAEKTLWDWLQLLVIPLALAIIAFLFNEAQAYTSYQLSDKQHQVDQQISNEQHQLDLLIAEDQQHESLLEGYFDKMSDVLLNKNLSDPSTRTLVGAVVRSRTLTVLRSLGSGSTELSSSGAASLAQKDSFRKGLILQFLYEAGLISGTQPAVDLRGADFSGADLSPESRGGVSLSGLELTSINLSGANFTNAQMMMVNLEGADLQDATFEGAFLHKADLCGSNLLNADFSNADLTQAYLDTQNPHGALLDGAKLGGVISC